MKYRCVRLLEEVGFMLAEEKKKKKSCENCTIEVHRMLA